MSSADYLIAGMSCAHCENAVREEVVQLPGVRQLSVNAGTGLLHLEAEGEPDDAAVLAAVEEAGYSAERV